MPLDLSTISKEALGAAIDAMLQAAYERGRQDTLADILAAVQAPNKGASADDAAAGDAPRTTLQSTDAVHRLATQRNGKAPRGLVPSVVRSVMVGKSFLAVPDIEDLVIEAEPRISRKSVGNELRRQEGSVYERDVPGGYRWKLVGQNDEAEEGDETNPSASFFDINQGGADGTTLATH